MGGIFAGSFFANLGSVGTFSVLSSSSCFLLSTGGWSLYFLVGSFAILPLLVSEGFVVSSVPCLPPTLGLLTVFPLSSMWFAMVCLCPSGQCGLFTFSTVFGGSFTWGCFVMGTVYVVTHWYRRIGRGAVPGRAMRGVMPGIVSVMSGV